MQYYNLSQDNIAQLMSCIKMMRSEQDDNLLHWEKTEEDGFCMQGEPGWNEITAEERRIDYNNYLHRIHEENYDSGNEQVEAEEKQYHANELEEGELVDEPQNATGVGVEEQYTQNGWLKMAQDHKDEEFSAVNYLSTQPFGEASELEEGELVDHQEMEQLHKEEEICSYCRGLQNHCWCNWKKPTIGNIFDAIDEELI